MSILTVVDLAKSYGGVAAVAGVGFALGRGEVLALIGPNGAGKTTCFNMLGGQTRPDRGRVLLEDRDITGVPARRLARLGIGRTFQITQICASMSLAENVQLALIAHRLGVFSFFSRAAALYRTEALALLERLGLAALAERLAGVLAYGDLKRLELAVTLAQEPRLLLMDEPTAGMAAQERLALMALAVGLARERGISVLFTEHDMDVVFAHADRIIVLDRGRILAEGAPAAVRNNPQVREVYLGAGRMVAA
jgi:branched-chain amino acid transport system ATP-binding protein